MASLMDFVTRMFLRDYAFIETLSKNRSHHANCEFAAISVGAWVVALGFMLVTAVCLVLRDVIPPPLNIATASKPVTFVECLAIVLGGAWFVENKIRPFRSARPDCIDDFKTPRERLKWWLTSLSIVAFVATLAGLLMVFHGYV